LPTYRRLLPLLVVLSLPAGASATQVWTALSTEKIRPSVAARADEGAVISAARNEFEAFQVVVTGPATGVRASAGDLAGPGTISGVRLYREALLNLASASALDGWTGPTPDGLVPDVDEIVGERRNAFPFDVPAGESRAIWVEVHVPQDAAPGDYAGAVSVTWTGGGATVPVKLTVWPFTLPSTSSLKSVFGLSWTALPAAHHLSGDALSALRARYGQLALDHRISLSHIDDGVQDLGHFGSFYGGEIAGTAPTTLPGAHLTSVQAIWDPLGAWASYAKANGFLDRLFQYTCDEPPLTCAWSDIPARAAQAKAADPAFRTLVTTTIQEATQNGVDGSIDVMVPVINYLEDRQGTFAGPQRAAYDAFLAKDPRHEVWTYQSCMSHGCGGTVNFGSPTASDQYYTGWPSYMIDASAVRNRALEWLSFRFDLSGELYWETTQAYSHDPWQNQWDFSGNGDGTLFVPGTPAEIGGTTDIPCATIRLKMIREGMEDYEYLKLLSDAGDPALAKQIAAELFPHAYETDQSPQALMAARARIAARIVELTGGAGSGSGSGAGGTAGAQGLVAPAAKSRSGCASGGAGIFALLGLAGAIRRRRG
jgi:hypothetical protein